MCKVKQINRMVFSGLVAITVLGLQLYICNNHLQLVLEFKI